jgi:TPR repeat protein
MNSSKEEAKADICCANANANANCGVTQVDEVKMEECNRCDLVLCGSDKCREKHRGEHDKECKNRKVELHDDDDLFTQPDGSHLGECPLCFLPMPLGPRKSSLYSCCSKSACNGCVHANYVKNGNFNCPFCREPAPDGEESYKRIMERVKAHDPAAVCEMGRILYHKGDCDTAFGYFTKAAELGDAVAHNNLGYMYGEGYGVEKDDEKAVYHYEQAAIGGHPYARHHLGCVEEENGNVERAVKHFIIAAKLGYEDSMKELWKHYSAGNITKEDLEVTLRTHQAAINEMKSPERDEVDDFWTIKFLFPSLIRRKDSHPDAEVSTV